MADERVLLLDDDRGRRELARHYYPNLITCESVDTCKELLELNSWDLVSLDFTLPESGSDRLEPGAPGGMELAAFIAKRRPDVAQFRIHGHASPGSSKMARVIMEAGYDVVWHPWGDKTLRTIR